MDSKKLSIIFFVLILFSFNSFSQSLDDGIKLFDEKKFAQAKTIIEKAYKANPKDPKTAFYMGRIFSLRDFLDLDEAVDLIEFAVEKDPKNAKYHFFLGVIYGQKASDGMFAAVKYGSKIKDEFEKSASLDPTYIEAKEGLVRFYLRAPSMMGGDINKAKEHAKAIEKLDVNRSYPIWAEIFKEEKNDAKYEEFTLKAISINPKNTEPINRLGYFYIEKKNYDKAISMFQKYGEIAPTDPNAFDSLGDGYKAKNDLDNALKSYLKAVSIDPKFSASVMNAANIYKTKNMKKEAISVLKNYIAIAPKGDPKDKAEDFLDDLD